MRCPVDGTTLALAERSGVQVSHCAQCRGMWLDRGDLDRIIERSGALPFREEYDESYRPHPEGGQRYDPQRYGRRRGAFTALSDLPGGGD